MTAALVVWVCQQESTTWSRLDLEVKSQAIAYALKIRTGNLEWHNVLNAQEASAVKDTLAL